jgi:arylsulfatase
MQTYIQYPPRKAQGENYTGPITLSAYERFKWVRDNLKEGGFNLPLPSGN